MQDHGYEVRYRFSSTLDEIEGYRYMTTYLGELYEIDEDKQREILVGKIELKLMLLTRAINEGYPIFEVFDLEAYTFDLGEKIMDLEEGELDADIMKHYDDEILNQDICILQRIEIIESHRRKGLGKKVVKDVYSRFASSCGLFVVQAFPLQFESRSNEIGKSDWENKLKFNTLEKDFEKAFYQLKAFYKNLGFDHIEGHDNFMFLNPIFKNEKLDRVVLE